MKPNKDSPNTESTAFSFDAGKRGRETSSSVFPRPERTSSFVGAGRVLDADMNPSGVRMAKASGGGRFGDPRGRTIQEIADGMHEADGRNVMIYPPFNLLFMPLDFIGQVLSWGLRPYDYFSNLYEEWKYREGTRMGSSGSFATMDFSRTLGDRMREIGVFIASIVGGVILAPTVGVLTGVIAALERLVTGKSRLFSRMRDRENIFSISTYRLFGGIADAREWITGK